MKLRRPHTNRIPPLGAPRQPGERQYTTLQLTRIARRDGLWSVVRLVLSVAAVGAAIAFALSSRGNDAAIARQNDRLEAQNAELKAAIVEIRATRAEGRKRTCGSDQHFELKHNDLVQGTQNFVSKLLTDAANDPNNSDKRSFILSYAADRVAELETTKVQVRGCSDKAIADFYDHVADPQPCPHGEDDRGFCI